MSERQLSDKQVRMLLTIPAIREIAERLGQELQAVLDAEIVKGDDMPDPLSEAENPSVHEDYETNEGWIKRESGS